MIFYNIRRYKNYGVISPIPTGKLAGILLKYMSYERKGKEFMPNPEWAMVKLYNVKKGIFPWGFRRLVNNIFNQWCKLFLDDNFNIDFYKIDDFNITEKVFNSNNGLRDYQRMAIFELLKYNGGVIQMPTGSGKTRTIIEWLKILDLSSTIVVTTLDLKRQWIRECVKYGLNNFSVINWQSSKINEFIANSKVVVFDECHHVSAKNIYNTAMKVDTDVILAGCSATVKRDDGEDMKIQAALGDIVYSISRRELIDKGFLADALVKYYRPVFDCSRDKLFNYNDIYMKHIVENFDRNMIIIDEALKFSMSGKKVLILVSRISHGEFLFKLIVGVNKNSVFLSGGSTKGERDVDLSSFDIIIATQIFDEGIDLPEFDVVILAAGGKSSVKLVQRVGRVLRPKKNGGKAFIIDFVDTPRYLGAHYKRRRSLLSEDFEVFDV